MRESKEVREVKAGVMMARLRAEARRADGLVVVAKAATDENVKLREAYAERGAKINALLADLKAQREFTQATEDHMRRFRSERNAAWAEILAAGREFQR